MRVLLGSLPVSSRHCLVLSKTGAARSARPHKYSIYRKAVRILRRPGAGRAAVEATRITLIHDMSTLRLMWKIDQIHVSIHRGTRSLIHPAPSKLQGATC
jgi:hypothetical protein